MRKLFNGQMKFASIDIANIEIDKNIDQAYRRVIQNESIPYCEKVFSIFETHIEWVSKGEAGVLREPGRHVAIVEDAYGFINKEIPIANRGRIAGGRYFSFRH